MSYTFIVIKIIIISCLIQVRLHTDKRVAYPYPPCLKESDCDRTGFFDCFCMPPSCLCYLHNETRQISKFFNRTGVKYGEHCETSDDCRYVNCHRISKTCLCYTRYRRENDICIEGSLGHPCASICAYNSFCDETIGYKCNCFSGSYIRPNDTTDCHAKVIVGEDCLIDEACNAPAKCKNGKCDCNYKEQYEASRWCFSKVKLGGECLRNDYCYSNVCSDNICVCPYGYQEVHGICAQNLFNITCQSDRDCLEKMNYTMCDIQKKLCTCNLKTYRGNETCIPKKHIGKFCNENVECLFDYCKDHICTCRYGYYLFGEVCTEVISNYASCAFKARIDMSKIVNSAKYLSISWYQISKDIEQKAEDIYQTKLSETFISISAYAGEQDGIVEALIYFRIIIDDISLNLSELLVDKMELFEPIPFLPEPDEVKVIALEGICMKPQPLISYEIKIGIIVTSCLLFLTMLVATGIIWQLKNNPKKLISWVQREFTKSVYIPPIQELKDIVRVLIDDALVIKNTDKVLSYRELQAIYIRYFYYLYYDFDYSYIYDMNYPYETYMDTIEDDFNYNNSQFDELVYMVSSNDDYNYVSKEEYDNGYNYEADGETNV